MRTPPVPISRWPARWLLVGLGSLVVLALDGFIAGFILVGLAQGTHLTQADLFVGVLTTGLAIGAGAVFARLLRGRPPGLLSGSMLLAGLLVPVVVLGPYLFGVPFVY